MPKVLRAKFLGSNGFFCFSRICKFDSFKKPFATITSLSELYIYPHNVYHTYIHACITYMNFEYIHVWNNISKFETKHQVDDCTTIDLAIVQASILQLYKHQIDGWTSASSMVVQGSNWVLYNHQIDVCATVKSMVILINFK